MRLFPPPFSALIVLGALVAACGDDDGPMTDAGTPDAGMEDAGPADAGHEVRDFPYTPCVVDEQCPGITLDTGEFVPGFCRTALESGIPGGICSRACSGGNRGPCLDEVNYNECVLSDDGLTEYCHKNCRNGLDCGRVGLTCVYASPGDTIGLCEAICSAESDCGPGAMCNIWSGDCIAEGTPITGNPTGGACLADEECNSGRCYRDRDAAGPNGFNGGYCLGPCILPEGYNTSTFYYDASGLPQGTCADGDVCFPSGSYARGDLGVCLDGCASDADCRVNEGYACSNRFSGASGVPLFVERGVCLPVDCSTTACPGGYGCQAVPTSRGTRNVCVRL